MSFVDEMFTTIIGHISKVHISVHTANIRSIVSSMKWHCLLYITRELRTNYKINTMYLHRIKEPCMKNWYLQPVAAILLHVCSYNFIFSGCITEKNGR